MKIINRRMFYFGTEGTVYRGLIELSQKEFTKALKSIKASKKLDRFTKGILKSDLQQKQGYKEFKLFALRVTITDFIVNLFENTSRYNYKKQNYIIKVK